MFRKVQVMFKLPSGSTFSMRLYWVGYETGILIFLIAVLLYGGVLMTVKKKY